MKRRAHLLEETRRRIVDATVSLHEEVGPARTTVSAIAERARVSRPTVYKQFPDDLSLFTACSGRFAEQRPQPELVGVELEHALRNLYRYFSDNEQMIGNVDRDAGVVPAVAQVYARALDIRGRAADDHAERVAPGRTDVRAVLRLAFTFCTWQHLTQAGLGVGEAASLMASLAEAAAAR